jgi:hypothetical protein
MAESSKLLIPPKLHVGFNRRTDTYTNILGFIIYTDTKGVKHTETSWNNWRNQEIPAIDCDNVPTEGFVLNGKVGGGRSYGWHSNERIMKVRVFDPRNWEFEITIPNLLNILRDSACSPGKGLEGKFVYAWAGRQGREGSLGSIGLAGLGVVAFTSIIVWAYKRFVVPAEAQDGRNPRPKKAVPVKKPRARKIKA